MFLHHAAYEFTSIYDSDALSPHVSKPFMTPRTLQQSTMPYASGAADETMRGDASFGGGYSFAVY